MKKFDESLNLAVFTSKFVILENKQIIYISHEIEDGCWQFLSNDEFENFEEVAMIVSLEEIIKLDETVLEVADLPLGYYATREKIGDKWIINKNVC